MVFEIPFSTVCISHKLLTAFHGTVVSREGRIMDIALFVEVGFEPWVKDGELWTAHLVE